MYKDEAVNGVIAVLNPPFPHIFPVKKLIGDTPNLFLGSQNCSDKASGAYTGETSAAMLASFGATYVIIGHSERREYFKESNQLLTENTKQALANGLTPIFCCGEPLGERDAENHFEYVGKQLHDSLSYLSNEEFDQVQVQIPRM